MLDITRHLLLLRVVGVHVYFLIPIQECPFPSGELTLSALLGTSPSPLVLIRILLCWVLTSWGAKEIEFEIWRYPPSTTAKILKEMFAGNINKKNVFSPLGKQ